MSQIPVYFSPLAQFKIELICQFLKEEWSVKSKDQFLLKLSETSQLLAEFPESGPASEILEGVRKIKIEKHNTMFYRIKSKAVEVITVVDNRQNPEKIRLELIKYGFRDL